jgi:hypothetical protein
MYNDETSEANQVSQSLDFIRGVFTDLAALGSVDPQRQTS